MNKTELMVPDQSPEESAVVERFITTSREIVPSVQISLAKRILHPDSGRVVCLAAHTSVPLRDDELASVSDLALRLSDGTNVRLSLSFFNDGSAALGGGASAFAPYARTIYDPEWYSTRNQSKFPVILLCTLMLCAAGGYWTYKQATATSPIAQSTMSPPPLARVSPPQARTILAHAVPAAHPRVATAATLDELSNNPIPHHSKHQLKSAGREARHATAANAFVAPRNGMFVPPPPPMEVAVPPNQLPMFQWGVVPTQATDGQAGAKRNASKSAPLANPAATRGQATAEKESDNSTSATSYRPATKTSVPRQATALGPKATVSSKPAPDSSAPAVSSKQTPPAKSLVSTRPPSEKAEISPVGENAQPSTKPASNAAKTTISTKQQSDPTKTAVPAKSTSASTKPVVSSNASPAATDDSANMPGNTPFRIERFSGSSSSIEAPLPGITEYVSPSLERIVPPDTNQ